MEEEEKCVNDWGKVVKMLGGKLDGGMGLFVGYVEDFCKEKF